MVDAVPHRHDKRGNSDHDHPEAYNYTRIVISAALTGCEGAMHFFLDEGGHAVLQNIDGLFGCREGDHGSRDTDH